MTPRSNRASIQPAEERLGNPSRRTLGAVLVFAALTLLICNAGAWWLQKTFPVNRGYVLVETKWGLLDQLEAPVDVLIVGDSSCNSGINPRVIEERTGVRALNLCTVGNYIALDGYWMLDRHIREYGPPGMVIVGHVYDIWHRPLTGIALSRVPMAEGFWSRYVAPLDLTLLDRIQYLLGRYAPLYAENQSLARNIKRPWLTSALDFCRTPRGFACEKKARPGKVKRDVPYHRKFVRDERFRISPENLLALEAMAELAREHGFQIYVVNAPMYDRLFENAAIQAYLGDIAAFFEGFAREHPKVHHIFAEPRLFPASDMTTVDHLATKAANVFSHDLVDAILARREAR